jgi:hypothetical protein
MAGLCEHCNKLSGSIIAGNFFTNKTIIRFFIRTLIYTVIKEGKTCGKTDTEPSWFQNRNLAMRTEGMIMLV